MAEASAQFLWRSRAAGRHAACSNAGGGPPEPSTTKLLRMCPVAKTSGVHERGRRPLDLVRCARLAYRSLRYALICLQYGYDELRKLASSQRRLETQVQVS